MKLIVSFRDFHFLRAKAKMEEQNKNGNRYEVALKLAAITESLHFSMQMRIGRSQRD